MPKALVEESTGNSLTRFIFIMAIFLLPILYLLSSGPVAWLFQVNNWSTQSVKAFYAPVVYLHDNTALKNPIEFYFKLFGVK